jgi:nitroreductase
MPATRIRIEAIVDALQLACRAPSLHNSQPWRWVVVDHRLDLYVDPARVIRSADATGRQALLSCGAALDHFRVAMTAAGWNTSVRRFPDSADPHHLATIEFAAAGEVSYEQKRRADAILLRHSDRLPLAAPPDWERLTDTLTSAAGRGPAQLHVVAEDLRSPLAEVSRLAEAMRLYDARYHAELHWWTASFAEREGIPRSALITATESERVDIGRSFPVTASPERRGHLDEDRAGVLVLSTADDSRESVLRCGEALSAVLLDATMAGMSTCTVTHVTEVPEGRDVLASLIGGTAIPQALVRVGLAPAMDTTPPPTPRRPVREVLEIRGGAAC